MPLSRLPGTASSSAVSPGRLRGARRRRPRLSSLTARSPGGAGVVPLLRLRDRGRPDRPRVRILPAKMVVGVVSDTHGLMRPQALERLRGVQRIVHAGDIGSPEVLAALEAIAPVTAVRGNNDRGAWARALPETAVLGVGRIRLYVLHDVKALDVDPRRAAFDAVIAGHSHRPSLVV